MINDPFAEDGIIACQYCGSGEYLYNEDGNRKDDYLLMVWSY